MIPSFTRVVLKRLAWLMFAYALARLLFLLWNPALFAETPAKQVFLAFVYGMRFDIAAILFMNVLLLPIWLLPTLFSANKFVRYFDLTVFYIVNWIGLGFSFIDAEFVKFIGKRTSFDLLLIQDDLRRHSASVILTYWYFLLALSLLAAFLTWVIPRFQRDPQETFRRPQAWLVRVVLIGFAVVGMRGGVQFKPLHPMHAYFSTRHEVGLLTLNTPFNLMKTRPRGAVHRERYFSSNREAIDRLRQMTDLSRPPLAVAKDWNVVVLILESLSLEYMGISNDYPGYTPFLDELSKKSYFFPLNFANARRSIEGLPAVLCGLPAMMFEPIITSDFSSNRLDCLPKVLGQRGYSTYFLHGAHNGSMHFDTFSKIAGFENFIGLNEYPKDKPEDLDQYWGVLDEPMLQYAVKTIDMAKPPVMLSVFTLSSHHPYYVPPQHQGKFPKGTLEIHETIGYTDYSLKKFFESAEKRPWFNKTIFVITADHTQKSDQKKYSDLIGAWRVPFFIYVPGWKPQKPPTSNDRITQHVDIVPSIMDLLGVALPDRLLVGQSVFDQGKPGRVYNYTSYSYWYMDPDVFLDFGREPYPLKAYVHKNTYEIKEVPAQRPGVENGLLNIKAVVHYINEGLLGNSLYNWQDGK